MKKIDKSFIPYNDDIENNPDKEHIVGPYSTFDPELAKLKKRKPAHMFSEEIETKYLLALKFKRSAEKVSKSKADQFYKYLTSKFKNAINDVAIKQMLRTFESNTADEKILVLDKMLNFVGREIEENKGIKIPPLLVMNEKIDSASFGFFTLFNGSYPLIVIDLSKSKDLSKLMGVVFHEYIHFIDIVIPQLSVLGAQISDISSKNNIGAPDKIPKHWNTDGGLYEMNPLEINAYMQGREKFGRE